MPWPVWWLASFVVEWFIRGTTFYARQCPRCGKRFTWGINPWVDWHRSGSQFDGVREAKWREGLQTCPRCRRRWLYFDSGP